MKHNSCTQVGYGKQGIKSEWPNSNLPPRPTVTMYYSDRNSQKFIYHIKNRPEPNIMCRHNFENYRLLIFLA